MFCVSRSIVVFVSSRKRHTRCALVTGVQTGALPISAQWIRDADLGDYYQLRSAPAGQVGVEPMDFSAWDRDDLLHEHVHAVEGGREITVLTDGMRCAACAWLVDRALRREPGVLDTSANAVTGRTRIAWEDRKSTRPNSRH